jgi:hypothetical protein
MSRQYTNRTEIENYLLKEIDPAFDSQIDSWIEQCSKEIETKTQRVFQTVESDVFEERVYDGKGRQKLLVDEFIELDSVTITNDGEDEEIDDILEYPNNMTPKFILFYEEGFPTGNQNITVSAKWGYSEEPPDDIKFACTVLVAGIIQGQTQQNEGSITSERIGNYSVTYDTEKGKKDFDRVTNILKFYRRITI